MDRIRQAIESLPVIRRVTNYGPNWEPCNREAAIEQIDECCCCVHLHVNNAENGQKLLVEMAETVQRAIAEAVPSAELDELCSPQDHPGRKVVTVTTNHCEGDDATAEA